MSKAKAKAANAVASNTAPSEETIVSLQYDTAGQQRKSQDKSGQVKIAVHENAQPRNVTAKPLPRVQQLLNLLRRRQGATNAEMLQLTGWQPHSLRAALSGLRKKGHTLERDQDRNGQPRYRGVKAGAGQVEA